MEPEDTADKAASLDFKSKLAFFNSQNRANEPSQSSKDFLRRGPPAPQPPSPPPDISQQELASCQASTDKTREEAERPPLQQDSNPPMIENKSQTVDRRPPLQQDSNPPMIENKSQTVDRSNQFDNELRAKIKEVAARKRSGWSPNDMEIFKRPMCLIGAASSNVGPEGCAEGDKKSIALTLNSEVVSQLEMISWPMVVISVVGLYRTGKSYLMNRLAGSTSGFTLGDTIESTTKGIWAWCKIHPEKTNTVLLLLDTEGLGDPAKGDPNHDNRIFTLATLLCNCLVYNMKGAFDQDAVNKLTFVTKMASNIRYRGESSEDNNMLNLILPDFVLCVRDFSLKLSKGGIKITEDEYLESSLEERKGNDEQFNRPRECIRKYFPKRKCFTFPVPGDVDVLENLETLRFDQLSPRFKESTLRFISYIYSKTPKELVASKPVNGLMFAILATKFVTAIKNGAVPDVDDAFIAVAKAENAKIQKDAIEIFESQMKKILFPVSSSELEKRYTQAQQTALEYLRKNAVHDKHGTFENDAQMKMDNIWNRLRDGNLKQIKELCESKLQETYGKSLKGKIEKKAFEVAGGYRKFQIDMETMKKEYFDSLCNFDEHEVLWAWAGFVQKTKMDESKIIQADDKMSKKEKEDEEKRNEERIQHIKDEQETAKKAALEQQKSVMEKHYKDIEKERTEQMAAEIKKYSDLAKAKLDKETAQRELDRVNREQKENRSKWVGARVWNAVWNN